MSRSTATVVDLTSVGTDQLGGTTLDRYWSLRRAAKRQHRLFQHRGLLLHAAGIGQDQIRSRQGGNKIGVVQRPGELDTVHSAELRNQRLSNCWILMYRQDDLDIPSLGKLGCSPR